MPSNSINVEQLSKTYQVPEREAGFSAAVRSFFKRKYKDVKAVQAVNFTIAQGEIVGFLGPNGAGKTTTLKMLSGLLHPTGGKASVLGYTPWELKPDYLRSMTLVMGQRNRLSWDIPAADSFLLNQAIYRIPDAEYKQTYKELDEHHGTGTHPRVFARVQQAHGCNDPAHQSLHGGCDRVVRAHHYHPSGSAQI